MSYTAVCFDCDSTLVRIEGIDELAKRAGLGREVEELTEAAMNGECPLDAVYSRRLALIRPDRQAIDWLAGRYLETLLPGVCETVAGLQKHGVAVHIVSGGIRQALLPLARQLGIPSDRVHAVEIFFDAEGVYEGFDRHSPLAKSGGKTQVCRQLMADDALLVMVGDGQTDVETKQAGAYFIAFTGVFERSKVIAQADDYSHDFAQLAVKLNNMRDALRK
ncbi:MAG: HAD-IB family phosphatase [Gammaproteobacteria bacterium]